MNFEPWVWTELLAFDNSRPDGGAAAYIGTLGFVPEAVCLLVSAPDFVLQYRGMDSEYELPPDVCSRDAHPGNETRKRQKWSNFQLRSLIASLHKEGTTVYCSFFNVFHLNKFRKEWMSEHPEARQVWNSCHRGLNLNPTVRLADGTLFEDFFIPRLANVCNDYGFDGWHGPDGWGPLSGGGIMDTDFSDGVMEQFLEVHKDWALPQCLAEKCPDIVTQEERDAARNAGLPEPETGLSQLRERAAWLRNNHWVDWLNFNAERWCQFWKKAAGTLHKNGKKLVINSAWTKGVLDALSLYGIDYRKMMNIPIDTMVVEAVALGVSMTMPEGAELRHNDYAAALADIRAACPNARLIFLHGIKDVVELWDNLRHAAPAYEKELYKLANMFYRDEQGLKPCSDGLLACLADGILPHEWQFIRERWQASFDGHPLEAGQVTMLWSDAQVDGGLTDFLKDGFLHAQKQMAELMFRGVQMQTVCRIENWQLCSGPVFIPNVHLLEPGILEDIIRTWKSPVFVSGRYEALQKYLPESRTVTDGKMALAIFNGKGNKGELTKLPAPETHYIPDFGEYSFIKDVARQPVAENFWPLAAEMIQLEAENDFAVKGLPFAKCLGDNCNVLLRRISDDSMDVALENRNPLQRISATVQTNVTIKSLKVISSFPLRKSGRPDKYSFTIPVPPRGVTAVRIFF